MDVLESTVLQNNHELIINNVSVKESQILTYLLQSGTLTDNEYEDIKGTEYFHFSNVHYNCKKCGIQFVKKLCKLIFLISYVLIYLRNISYYKWKNFLAVLG